MFRNRIEILTKERLTILLTEQNALFALDVSHWAYVIDKGSILKIISLKNSMPLWQPSTRG